MSIILYLSEISSHLFSTEIKYDKSVNLSSLLSRVLAASSHDEIELLMVSSSTFLNVSLHASRIIQITKHITYDKKYLSF